MNRKILISLLSLILLLTFTTPALAQGPDGAQVVFGSNFVVESEQTLNRDLVVFGGNVTIEESSRVEGDVVVFGGNVQIDGLVDGDIGLIGGNITLSETAVIEGDIGLVGGSPHIEDGAEIRGDIQSLTNFGYDYDHRRGDDDDDDDEGNPMVSPVPPVAPDAPVAPERPEAPERPRPPRDYYRSDGPSFFGWIGQIVGDIVGTIFSLIILGIITWLVTAFLPEQMANVRDVVLKSTASSFGVGLITLLAAIVAVPLAFLLVVTICLALAPIAAYLVLGAAALFGWIVIGQIIGERLLAAADRPNTSFVFSSIVGVAVLTVVAKMPVISAIPCIGFLFGLIGSVVGIVAGLTGLGAVLLTRFGTRPYPAPASYYTGPSRPSSSPFGGGPRVRWTDEPDVSEEEVSASEAELNARIKAALAEADRTPPEAEPPAAPEPDETPEPEDEPDQDQPTSSRRSRPKPAGEPETGGPPEA
jgi:hypothetical protein